MINIYTSGLHSGGHGGLFGQVRAQCSNNTCVTWSSQPIISYYNCVRNRQPHSLRSDAPLTEVAVPLVLGNLRIVYQNSRWPIMQNGCQTSFRNTTLSCRWLPKTLNSINNCKTITDYYTIFNVIKSIAEQLHLILETRKSFDCLPKEQ